MWHSYASRFLQFFYIISKKIPVNKSSRNNFLLRKFTSLAKLYTETSHVESCWQNTGVEKKVPVGDNSRNNASSGTAAITDLPSEQSATLWRDHVIQCNRVTSTIVNVLSLYMLFDLTIACSLVKRKKKHTKVLKF